MLLERLIKIITEKQGGTTEFYWDAENKTWCVFGQTRDGLYYESDDLEAESEEEGRQDAADYLKMHHGEELLTTVEVGELLDMTKSGIRRAILEGRIPANKMGRDWIIRLEDALSYTRSPAGKPRKS